MQVDNPEQGLVEENEDSILFFSMGGGRSILIQVLSFDYDMKLDTVNDSSETAFFKTKKVIELCKFSSGAREEFSPN